MLAHLPVLSGMPRQHEMRMYLSYLTTALTALQKDEAAEQKGEVYFPKPRDQRDRAATSLTEDKTLLSGVVRFLVKEFHEHPKLISAGDNIRLYLNNKSTFTFLTNIPRT